MKVSELRKALEVLHKVFNLEVPLSQIDTFLMVAEKEGITEQEIAKQTTAPQTTVKRNINKLTGTGGAMTSAGMSVWGSHDEALDPLNAPEVRAMALCEKKDDGSLYLSEKGKLLINALKNAS